MSEDKKKKSFVLYADQKEVIEDLSFEEKGKLLDALFDFARSGEVPVFEDKSLLIAFKMFKVRIERDNDKYKEICEKRKEAISKRWDLQKNTKVYNCIQTDTNDTDKDKDKDKVKDKGKVKEQDKDKDYKEPKGSMSNEYDKNNISITTVGVGASPDPQKKKKKVNDISEEERELRRKAKDLFVEKYKEMFGTEYYWEAKDAANLPKLLKKIKFSRQSHNYPVDNDSLLDGFKKFLEHVKNNNFLLNNFTVPMLNGQYNAIMTGQKARNNELAGQVIRKDDLNCNKDNFFGV